MRAKLALLAVLFGVVTGSTGAHAAPVDFLDGHHNMQLVSIGQEGTIDVNRNGTEYGMVKGYLPGNSKITIDYTISGDSSHPAAFGALTKLVGESDYSFKTAGTKYYGFAADAEPSVGSVAFGWTRAQHGVPTPSSPLVLVMAGITDGQHGTISIFNYAPEKAFFTSFVESFVRLGHVVGHYTVSALSGSSVPLPASAIQFLLAMVGMLGFAYRKSRAAA